MSSSKKVVITDFNFPDIEIERQIISKEVDAEVSGFQCRSADEVCAVAKGADVLMVQFAPITEPVIACLPKDAVIVRYGVGYDNIDIKAANKRGIKVGYVPDYCKDEVADHTVTLLLTLLRRVSSLHQSVMAGYWQGVKVAGTMKPFDETYIGFYGLGRIGLAVMERLRPFGFKFLIHDPYLEKERSDALGAALVSGDRFWTLGDAFTLHAPLTKETFKVINKDTLGAMQKSAVIVNTARGSLVDGEALAQALQTGEIAGAALDVFEKEPLPLGSVLLNTPNLLMTPHMAWFSDASIRRLQKLAAEEAVRGLKGLPLRCPLH